jgi:hypothetical protein
MGADRPLHLVSRLPQDGDMRPRFMFRDREIAWYRHEAELVAAGFRLARRYRCRVYAAPRP